MKLFGPEVLFVCLFVHSSLITYSISGFKISLECSCSLNTHSIKFSCSFAQGFVTCPWWELHLPVHPREILRGCHARVEGTPHTLIYTVKCNHKPLKRTVVCGKSKGPLLTSGSFGWWIIESIWDRTTSENQTWFCAHTSPTDTREPETPYTLEIHGQRTWGTRDIPS